MPFLSPFGFFTNAVNSAECHCRSDRFVVLVDSPVQSIDHRRKPHASSASSIQKCLDAALFLPRGALSGKSCVAARAVVQK